MAWKREARVCFVWALLAVAACGSCVEDAPRPTLAVVSAGYATQAEAEALVADVLVSRTGLDVEAWPTRIQWLDVPAPGCWNAAAGRYLRYAFEHPSTGACIGGLTFVCDEIYVAWHPHGLHGGTFFAHELGHCYRQKLGLDRDDKHEDTLWWSAVDAANQALKDRGL